jgi:hypothetical protein
MDNGVTESDDKILAFDLPDEALERAASAEQNAFTMLYCTSDWYSCGLPQIAGFLRNCSGAPSSRIFAGQFLPPLPPRFILEIDIGKLLHVVVAHNKAGFLFLDGPGRREAALIAASDGR